MKVYVVIANWGEYEQYNEELRGVYASEADARAAIDAMPAIFEATKGEFDNWYYYAGGHERQMMFDIHEVELGMAHPSAVKQVGGPLVPGDAAA